MKIKAVCEKTGLTDRTVRYYIEEGLISPSFTENYLGRKSFDFSDEDIVELCDIAVLRKFDFSIEEIKELLCSPESSPVIVRAVKERIDSELLMNQEKLSVLSSLNEQTVYTVSELAKVLSKPESLTPAEEAVETNVWRRVVSVTKGSVFFLSVWLPIVISISVLLLAFFRCEHPIVDPFFLAIALSSFLPSLFSVLSSPIKPLRHRIVKRVLFFLCLVCIPISAFASFLAVNDCDHSWVELAVEVEASCAREGRVVRRCDICRDVVVETVERPAHTVVIDQAVEATCSYAGLSEGAHCSVCHTVLIQQEAMPKKDHTYVKIPVEPTCDAEGYVLWVCPCGYSYRDNVIAATERHDFEKNGEDGYICSFCSLEVCEYGFVDGSSSGGEQKMKYYITGKADKVNEQERSLVIYGKGKMPAPLYQLHHPWRSSIYVEEIRTVVICEGVTSIAEGAFSGSIAEDGFFGNPFHSVKCFIVKGTTLVIDPESSDVSGIECDITYVSFVSKHHQ